MYLIRLANGEEAIFKTVQELGAGIRKGVVGPTASIFHRRTSEWLPIDSHPHFRFAQSLADGAGPLSAAAADEVPSTASPIANAPAPEPIAATPVAVTRSADVPADLILADSISFTPDAVPASPDPDAGETVTASSEPIENTVAVALPPSVPPIEPPAPVAVVEKPIAAIEVAPQPLVTPAPPAPAPASVPHPPPPVPRPAVRPMVLEERPAAPPPAAPAPAFSREPVFVPRVRRGLGLAGAAVTALCLGVGLLAGWRLRVSAGSSGRASAAPAVADRPDRAAVPTEPPQHYTPAPAPSSLERGRPVRESVSMAAETPPIPVAAVDVGDDPLEPLARGELVARYEAAYAASRRQLESELAQARFADALAPAALVNGREALRGRRIVASAANIVAQYRRREVMIDKAYADTAEFQARRAGWSEADRRAWNARASLRESFESSDLAESMLSDADSLLGILVASRYRITGDAIRFDGPAASGAWNGLRARIAARNADSLAAPGRHPTLVAVRQVVAAGRVPVSEP